MGEQRTLESSEAIVIACLRTMSARLSEAATIAKVAMVFAEEGSSGRALDTAFDVEEPVRDASTLLKAAAIMKRACEGEGTGRSED